MSKVTWGAVIGLTTFEFFAQIFGGAVVGLTMLGGHNNCLEGVWLVDSETKRAAAESLGRKPFSGSLVCRDYCVVLHNSQCDLSVRFTTNFRRYYDVLLLSVPGVADDRGLSRCELPAAAV